MYSSRKSWTKNLRGTVQTGHSWEDITLRFKRVNQDENVFKKPSKTTRAMWYHKKLQVILTLQLSKEPQSNEKTWNFIKNHKNRPHFSYRLKTVLYKNISVILLKQRRVTKQCLLATDLSLTSLDERTTDEETLRRSGKKDSFKTRKLFIPEVCTKKIFCKILLTKKINWNFTRV